MYQIARSALDLLGAFTLLATLLFDSSAIGAFAAGQGELESPVLLLGGAILAMIVAESVFLFLDRVAPPVGRAVTAIVSFLLPLITLCLIFGIAAFEPHTTFIPPLAITMLCVTGICQIHCFTRLSTLDACSSFLSSAISLIAAILLLYIAFSVLNTPLASFTLLAFILTVTGALALNNVFEVFPLRKKETDSPNAPATSPAVPAVNATAAILDGDAEETQSVADIVILALPLVIVSLFCTFVLGQSQQEHLFDIFDAHFGMLLIILVAFAVIATCIYRRWRRNLSIDAFLAGLAIPLVLPILATLFEHLLPNLWIASLLMLTQILYLLFIWTSVLLIGRMISVRNSLTPGFLILFLMFYTAFMSLPQFEDIVIVSRVITLMSLGLLICLLFYFAHKANRTIASIEQAEPEMNLALQRKCEEAAKAYGLSPRESELLPMLAIGLSASVIGKRIILSDHTVKTHRYRIYQKIGISSHEELVEKLDLVTPSSHS